MENTIMLSFLIKRTLMPCLPLVSGDRFRLNRAATVPSATKQQGNVLLFLFLAFFMEKPFMYTPVFLRLYCGKFLSEKNLSENSENSTNESPFFVLYI